MELIPATLDHTEALMGWFGDHESAFRQGGPGCDAAHEILLDLKRPGDTSAGYVEY